MTEQTPSTAEGSIPTPKALAHVVYRTRRFDEVLDWYGKVFGARVQHRNSAMAFLTFDEEHHQFAFLDRSVIDPEGREPEARTWTGVDHLAWSYASLDDFRERKVHEPVSPIRGAVGELL